MRVSKLGSEPANKKHVSEKARKEASKELSKIRFSDSTSTF